MALTVGAYARVNFWHSYWASREQRWPWHATGICLAAVHPRFAVPHVAELAVEAVVAVVATTIDVRSAIGFSSFGVLLYYAIANAAAWTLTKSEGRPRRLIPIAGLAGCLLLAFALPTTSVLRNNAGPAGPH